MNECIYCGATEVTDREPIPATSDDAAWAELATEHTDGCEWIATRAHRIDEPAAPDA